MVVGLDSIRGVEIAHAEQCYVSEVTEKDVLLPRETYVRGILHC